MTQGEKLCLIRELHEAGSSIEAIAEATEYSVNSVKQLMPKAGIGKGRRLKDFEKEIVEMRSDGKSLREISEKFGFNICVISKFLCKIGCNKNRQWEKEEEFEEFDRSKLEYAKENKPRLEVVILGGRRYVDVYDLIVGS